MVLLAQGPNRYSLLALVWRATLYPPGLISIIDYWLREWSANRLLARHSGDPWRIPIESIGHGIACQRTALHSDRVSTAGIPCQNPEIYLIIPRFWYAQLATIGYV